MNKLFPTFETHLDIKSTTPELVNPRLIIKTAITVMTAGWRKPENEVSMGIMPVNVTMNNAIKATKSYHIRSQMNKKSANIITEKTIIIYTF